MDELRILFSKFFEQSQIIEEKVEKEDLDKIKHPSKKIEYLLNK